MAILLDATDEELKQAKLHKGNVLLGCAVAVLCLARKGDRLSATETQALDTFLEKHGDRVVTGAYQQALLLAGKAVEIFAAHEDPRETASLLVNGMCSVAISNSKEKFDLRHTKHIIGLYRDGIGKADKAKQLIIECILHDLLADFYIVASRKLRIERDHKEYDDLTWGWSERIQPNRDAAQRIRDELGADAVPADPLKAVIAMLPPEVAAVCRNFGNAAATARAAVAAP